MNHNQICKCNQHVGRHYFSPFSCPGILICRPRGTWLLTWQPVPKLLRCGLRTIPSLSSFKRSLGSDKRGIIFYYCLIIFQLVHQYSWTNMVSYLLFNKAGPKHCFTRWSPPVDVVSVQVWGTLFVSDHEGGVPTRSVKRSKPPLWFPYPLRPENKQHRLHCCAWHRLTLNFAVSYSSSQAASFVLRFCVNKSKQSILECSCAKKIACPNQNLLILFLNYNIISMGELHSLLLHGTKRNDQTIQEFKM